MDNINIKELNNTELLQTLEKIEEFLKYLESEKKKVQTDNE